MSKNESISYPCETPDPVREELDRAIAVNMLATTKEEIINRVLRVIRGHMEGRWLNFEKDSREYRLVADYALHQTLDFLPEEVKKSG